MVRKTRATQIPPEGDDKVPESPPRPPVGYQPSGHQPAPIGYQLGAAGYQPGFRKRARRPQLSPRPSLPAMDCCAPRAATAHSQSAARQILQRPPASARSRQKAAPSQPAAGAAPTQRAVPSQLELVSAMRSFFN